MLVSKHPLRRLGRIALCFAPQSRSLKSCVNRPPASRKKNRQARVSEPPIARMVVLMLMSNPTLRQLLSLVPEHLRAEMETSLPTLINAAGRLALECRYAEMEKVSFAKAVVDPRFNTMGRVYFGLYSTLQDRIPDEYREEMQRICSATKNGHFDAFDRLIWEVAARGEDDEAALARFFLRLVVFLNLRILCWDAPFVEATGVLDEIEEELERIVAELLEVPAMFEPDVRPLHVIVAEALLHASQKTQVVAARLAEEMGSEFRTTLESARALRTARRLDARDAMMFTPGRSRGAIGSKQLADRYPQYYPSAGAVEVRRSRFRFRVSEEDPKHVTDRFIDILRENLGGEG